ncbi:MAG: ABC transporter ATP-binding protein [Bacteroidales bacterium]
MKILLSGVGKKFNTEWIFRDLSYSFEPNCAYAILGRNGSGKSTLLQVIAGSLNPSSGKVSYFENGKEIPVENIFRKIAIVAPYQELIEEFTLKEMIDFHFSFKSLVSGYSNSSVIERLGFKDTDRKAIRYFSSGMKQRVKLVLALLSDVPVILLDEPTMNLDETGANWFLDIINEMSKNRIILVCSNVQQKEISFCKDKILIEEFKPKKRT